MAVSDLGNRPHHFAIVLIPKFSMISFAATLDTLRIANRGQETPLFTWELLSQDGEPVTCSNGLPVAMDGPLKDLSRHDSLIVCSSFQVENHETKTLLNWLRRQDRLGVNIGAVCTGTHLLAAAGLLNSYRCCIHWENIAAFRERFTEIDVTAMLFEIDGRRFTCAGGTAPIDMLLCMIAEVSDRSTALWVADSLVHTPPRDANTHQRIPLPARIGTRHPKLATLVGTMEETLEEPLSVAELARQAGITPRQVERLFQRYIGYSPKKYYLELRLHRARQLLMQSSRPVMDIAVACGFSSSSHFARCYRTLFKKSPLAERSLGDIEDRSGSAHRQRESHPDPIPALSVDDQADLALLELKKHPNRVG